MGSKCLKCRILSCLFLPFIHFFVITAEAVLSIFLTENRSWGVAGSVWVEGWSMKGDWMSSWSWEELRKFGKKRKKLRAILS